MHAGEIDLASGRASEVPSGLPVVAYDVANRLVAVSLLYYLLSGMELQYK